MKFGEKIRYIRGRFSLTIEQLAVLLNVSQSYISHVEHNRRKLSRDKIMTLAKELAIPVEFFLCDELKTWEEIEFEKNFKAMLNAGDYANYFSVVRKALAASISPEELEQTIEFLRQYNKIKIHQREELRQR